MVQLRANIKTSTTLSAGKKRELLEVVPEN
jgi:hypothetical protein